MGVEKERGINVVWEEMNDWGLEFGVWGMGGWGNSDVSWDPATDRSIILYPTNLEGRRKLEHPIGDHHEEECRRTPRNDRTWSQAA